MRKLTLNEIRRNAVLMACRRTASAEQSYVGTLSGNVVDDADAALENVVVTVVGTSLTDTTDASGDWEIAGVQYGSRQLSYALATYRTDVVTQKVNAAAVTVAEKIVYSLYDIAGNIVDALSAAMEGVTVNLYSDALKANLLDTTETDASGDYAFTGEDDVLEIIAGTYYVEAVFTGYTADEDPLEVAVAADVSDADFVLTAD